MKQFVKNIIDKFERNEKELLINKFGSTIMDRNEKIRSGQSYLYKKHGIESEVIEIRFNKNIICGMLQKAYMETIKRYSYFNTKLIEKDEDFYIVQNEQALMPKRSSKLLNLGDIRCGHHLIDVTYFYNNIFISSRIM